LRATRGDDFRISKMVCNHVIDDRQSLLVKDTRFESKLQASQSIVAERVRSLIAVPLQTQEQVIGLIYVDTPNVIQPFTREDLSLLTVMANVAAIRIEHARLAEIEALERVMSHELEQAGEIQRGLLPNGSPEVQGADVSGYNAACNTVGGDYYDFIHYEDGRVGVVLGDVSGKGMPASLMMSGLHARTHLLMETPVKPSEYMERLNRSLCATCPSNRFVTLAAGVFDPQSGKLTWANGGHNPPILIRADGSAHLMNGGGLVLGIMKQAKFEDMETTLQPGDLVAIYSDGITEAADPTSEEEFGEERLARVLAANKHLPTDEIVQVVLKAVEYFTGNAPAADDATIVLIKKI
jgi:serine phosphatase RsbU (regulator of sigma subunit)